MRRRRAAVLSLVALALGVGALALPIASGEPAAPARPTSWSDEQKVDAKPVVRNMQEHGRSAPLKTIATRYAERQPDYAYVPSDGVSGAPTRSPSTTSAVPAPSQVFEGIANTTFVAPPDPTGEVSPTQYVEAVNADDGAFMAVFSRDGEELAPPFRMERLWEKGSFCRKNGQGDPIVNYDQFVDRWIVT